MKVTEMLSALVVLVGLRSCCCSLFVWHGVTLTGCTVPCERVPPPPPPPPPPPLLAPLGAFGSCVHATWSGPLHGL